MCLVAQKPVERLIMKLNIRILLSLFRAVSPTPGCAALPLANLAGAAAR